MKIRMKTLAAGPSGVFKAGQERDVDEKTAKALLDGGYAEYVGRSPIAAEEIAPPSTEDEETTEDEGSGESEAAVVQAPETAVMPKPRPRSKR